MDQQFVKEGWVEGGNFGSYSSCSRPPSPGTLSNHSNGQVDSVLYKNLVEMLPLVQSLMDSRVKSAFPHRASIVFTPNPPKKTLEQKNRKTPQSTRGSRKTSKEGLQSENGKNGSIDNEDDAKIVCPKCSANGNTTNFEVLELQSRIEELEKNLATKENELVKYRENSNTELEALSTKIESLHHEIEERDGIIRSAHLQLCYKKNDLTDAKLLLKKSEEDAKASEEKVKKLQDELDILKCQIAAFTSFLDATDNTKNGDNTVENDESKLNDDSCSDDFDMQGEEDYQENASSKLPKEELKELEQAKREYLASVIAAKNKPGEESLSLVASYRLQLQKYLERPALENALCDQLVAQALRYPTR